MGVGPAKPTRNFAPKCATSRSPALRLGDPRHELRPLTARCALDARAACHAARQAVVLRKKSVRARSGRSGRVRLDSDTSQGEVVPVAPSGHTTDISFGEIIAFEEERFTGRAGKRVGEHVAEIQAGGAMSLAETSIGSSRLRHVLRVDGDHHNFGLVDEQIEFACDRASAPASYRFNARLETAPIKCFVKAARADLPPEFLSADRIGEIEGGSHFGERPGRPRGGVRTAGTAAMLG